MNRGTKGTNKVLTNIKQSAYKAGKTNMRVLNTAENVILDWGDKNRELLKGENVKIYFAKQLGFKCETYLYHIFQKRQYAKLTVETLHRLYQITQDDRLIDAIINELKSPVMEAL